MVFCLYMYMFTLDYINDVDLLSEVSLTSVYTLTMNVITNMQPIDFQFGNNYGAREGVCVTFPNPGH